MTVRTPAYVAIAVVLFIAGSFTLFSIGIPLLLTGVAMLAVLPWRRRREVLGPALAAPWAFTLGYVAIAPAWCSSSSMSGATANGVDPLPARTECGNLLGIGYSGVDPYRPPLLPAVLVGFALAVVVVVLVHRLMTRKGSS